MINEVAHIGLTVKDMDESIDFYKNVLGLNFEGELLMQGKETDILFNMKNCKVRVAYLNNSENIVSPSIELIQFIDKDIDCDKASLFKTSISEICFKTNDIDKVYNHLLKNNIECISSPQSFDFTKYGFGKSKAMYFKDPNGIILELIEVNK